MIWATSIWKLECSNRSKIHSVQKCYLCLRYVVSPMCPGRTFIHWCRRGESNPRPRDYETLALPLSYAGTGQSCYGYRYGGVKPTAARPDNIIANCNHARLPRPSADEPIHTQRATYAPPKHHI